MTPQQILDCLDGATLWPTSQAWRAEFDAPLHGIAVQWT